MAKGIPQKKERNMFSSIGYIIPVVLIWLAIIIITQLAKFLIKKSGTIATSDNADKIKEVEKHYGIIDKGAKLIALWATILAIIVITLAILFMTNPSERKEIKTIPEAQIESNFKEPSKSEIEESNKDVIEKKHLEKEREATEDNNKAMEEATEIFSQDSK